MPKKIYQSTMYMVKVIGVEIDGIGYQCEFKGGKYFPEKINGTYATSNVKIQKAIEEHEGFGGDFILIKTIEDLKPAKKEPVKDEIKDAEPPQKPDPIEPVVPTIDIENPEPTAITPTGEVIVNEVKNSQDAKLYLNKNFDVPFSRLNNVEKVMKESKTANLLFPNWKH